MSLDQRSASRRKARSTVNGFGPQLQSNGYIGIVPVQPAWTDEALVPVVVPTTRMTEDGRRALCAFARRMRELAPG
jgi:hypothetical protein